MTAGWRVLALDKAFGAAVVGERIDYDLRTSRSTSRRRWPLSTRWLRRCAADRTAVSSTSARSPPLRGTSISGTAHAKAALLNITKSYAAHLGPDGVLVNAVAPGPTRTAMYRATA